MPPVVSSYRFLLDGEDVVIEELVELLVRIVDAELLEGIRLEVFEAENVQYPDELGAVLS